MDKPNTSHQSLTQLQFYHTLPHACSYLAERQARTVFLDPDTPVTSSIYSQLSLQGFRRSGEHIYRPQCENCQACQAARIDVANFQPSRQQQRVIKRNRDLQTFLVDAEFIDEHYQLYADYLNTRHADGDMYPANEEQYRNFLLNNYPWSKLVEFRNPDNRLLAVAAVDRLADGLSAIYTFFSPQAEDVKRSLGVYAVLWQLAEAQQLRLPYVYLGYYIAESDKMNYKKNYQPLEVFSSESYWQRLEN